MGFTLTIPEEKCHLIYVLSNCGACNKLIKTYQEDYQKKGVSVFILMVENEETISKYVIDNNISIPVFKDKDGLIIQQLDLKIFPAILKIHQKEISDVYFGIPDKIKFEDLLKF